MSQKCTSKVGLIIYHLFPWLTSSKEQNISLLCEDTWWFRKFACSFLFGIILLILNFSLNVFWNYDNLSTKNGRKYYSFCFDEVPFRNGNAKRDVRLFYFHFLGSDGKITKQAKFCQLVKSSRICGKSSVNAHKNFHQDYSQKQLQKNLFAHYLTIFFPLH